MSAAFEILVWVLELTDMLMEGQIARHRMKPL